MARSKRLKSQSMQSKKPSVQSRRRLLYYGGAVLALALIAFAVYGLLIPKRSADSASSSANAQTPAEIRVGSPAPDLTFTAVDGIKHRLSEFRGRPVMLWLFATWCPTCQAGTAAVAQNLDQLKQAGVQIIQLELYNNLGYQGPSVEEFARHYAGSAYPSPDWLWGEASQEGSYAYDPKGYPDIYFLIDRDGLVRAINGAPSATMDQITSFARGVH